ncbi:hypothetical protein [Bacillus kwashiorkori]|uniref:hypothetical protein n=1 Tax=Bacillus kwashiorkori TaxID=1522318 RepID=UPI0007841EE2|nr:hypothetical protein [Bacillus kwashiorkori]
MIDSLQSNQILRQTSHFKDKMQTNFYLFCEENHHLLSINNGATINDQINISVAPFYRKEELEIVKIELQNHHTTSVHVKIFVENELIQHKRNQYVFASPSLDVLFFANGNSLFLSSGSFLGKSICQYGAVSRTHEFYKNLQQGYIPFNPIGKGDVLGVYSLEGTIHPNETVQAYTWTLSSNAFSKSELLCLNDELKIRLAFYDER